MTDLAKATYALVFFARREPDGTLTLCLDAPSAEGFPTEIARGYDSPDQIIKVLVDALTAPAVADDRVAALEEYMPAMNQTIDEVNNQGLELTAILERLEELEKWANAIKAQSPDNRPPVRPRIPRPGGQQAAPPALRRSVASPNQNTQQDSVYLQPPVHQGPSVRPPMDNLKPDFERGSFIPHRPVASVGRGPGSEG